MFKLIIALIVPLFNARLCFAPVVVYSLQSCFIKKVFGCFGPPRTHSFKCFWTVYGSSFFKPLCFQVFPDFWGVSGLQTLIVSSGFGLLGCFCPSHSYRCNRFWNQGVLRTFKPLQFQVFVVFQGAAGPSNPYRFKCFWTFSFTVLLAFKPLQIQAFLGF